MEGKGLMVFVLRDAGGADCTNGGASSKFARFILVDESGEFMDGNSWVFSPKPDMPLLRLLPGHLGGAAERRDFRAVPEPPPGKRGEPMFGGNFVFSSDSRFPALGPIPIHDRWE